MMANYQRTGMRGLGDMLKVRPFDSLYYTPPYNFAIPGFEVPARNYYDSERMGLGCAGSCSCGGTCGGLSAIGDNTDWTSWAIVGVAATVLYFGLRDARRRKKSQAAMRRVRF
jgi:hypothetical protein